jgi:hypothetical protein
LISTATTVFYYPLLLPLLKSPAIIMLISLIQSKTIKQTLLQEIEESKRWLNLEKDESTYKRDAKRIGLINLVLENMKNPDIRVCDLIESKMNEIIDTLNKMDSAIEINPLNSEL